MLSTIPSSRNGSLDEKGSQWNPSSYSKDLKDLILKKGFFQSIWFWIFRKIPSAKPLFLRVYSNLGIPSWTYLCARGHYKDTWQPVFVTMWKSESLLSSVHGHREICCCLFRDVWESIQSHVR